MRHATAYGRPPQARYAAIRALGKLGGDKDPAPDAIVDTLTDLLDEEHFRTRMAVLDALQWLNSLQTLPALRAENKQLIERLDRLEARYGSS
jgi:hypothetical protein